MNLNKEIMDFFDNRVEYETSPDEIDYIPFSAMCTFISPFIPQIDKMIVLDSHNCILYLPEELEPVAKLLIDRSCTSVFDELFKGVTVFEEGYARLRVIGG